MDTVFIKSHAARVITGRASAHECGWGNQHVDADQNMLKNLKKVLV